MVKPRLEIYWEATSSAGKMLPPPLRPFPFAHSAPALRLPLDCRQHRQQPVSCRQKRSSSRLASDDQQNGRDVADTLRG